MNSALTAFTAFSTRYETPELLEENTLWILEENGTSSLSNVMAYHVFPVLFCLALPYLALPCLALSCLVLPREAPLSPLLFPRAAHPTEEEFETARYPIPGAMAHARMCQSNSSTAASVPQILAKSNVWRSECQCVNLQWSLRFIAWASGFSADPISAFLRGSCSKYGDHPQVRQAGRQAARSVVVRSAIAQRAPDSPTSNNS